MIEIDLEELFIGSMTPGYPVVYDTVYYGGMVSLDEFVDVEQFTGEGFADQIVSRQGSLLEIEIEELLLSISDGFPVVYDVAPSGSMDEILLGGSEPLPDDTLHLIDFRENSVTHEFTFENGLLKNWRDYSGGVIPQVHNTHTIVMSNGLVTAYSVAVGGTKSGSSNAVSMINGLIKSWTISE